MMMTVNRWQKVKEIFHSALEREKDERGTFLAQACAGDESLRSEVESLIAAHEKEGSFIDAPAYEVAAGLLADEAGDSLVGQQINHYRILAPLGAGGMGEVYLAQDTKLGRNIALKLLPASFTSDTDRLHRFQQEARSASALNHPNILTIHEVGEEFGRPFIATELIEGQTLREHLRGGSLELSEALEIILQTASALAAAHEVGIVHRDIKPENIMLRRDGYVKVLDFGLAKLAERKTDELKLEAPTRLHGNTAPGMVMGTVQYMSPEQARGLDVDERTDIWSLGVVLYEMLSGQAPFQGATPTDVTVSILEREPASLVALSGEMPAELDWIVKKALRKDREERYQTVREMLGDLRGVKQEVEFAARLGRSVVPERRLSQPQSATLISDGPIAHAATNKSVVIPTDEIKEAQATRLQPGAAQPKTYRTLALAAVAVLVVAGVGFALYKFFLQSKKVKSFEAGNITRLTNHGKAIHAVISPDGKIFAYVLTDAGKQSLWFRQISAANDTQIVPPAPVGYFGITFSHDSNEIYYVVKANDAGTLYRIPAFGGTPLKVLEIIDSAVSFSPDGKRLAFLRGDYPNRGESGIYIANTDGSNIQQIAARKSPDAFVPGYFPNPSWSPDGQLVACAVTNIKSECRVIAVGVEDKKERVLTPQTWPIIGSIEWLPDMSGLVMVARDQSSSLTQIWHLSYPGGDARKVTNDLNFYRSVSSTADGSKLVAIQLSGLFNVWVIAGGNTERAVKLPSDGGNQSGATVTGTQLSIGNLGFLGGNESISWTPDDRVVYVSTISKRGDIWIVKMDGSERKQLTNSAGNNHNPIVSPDGRYIVFTSTRSGQRNVWRMNIDGSDPQRLTDSLADFLPAFTPDGQWIIYSSLNDGTLSLWKVPTAGGASVKIIDREATNAVVSPDGKQIAYLFTEAAAPGAPPNRIAVIPFEGGDPVKKFEVPQGAAGQRAILHWSRDGRSLLYAATNKNASNIWSQPLDGGKPVQITNFTESLLTAYDWSRDGSKLACSRGVLIRDAVLINNAN